MYYNNTSKSMSKSTTKSNTETEMESLFPETPLELPLKLKKLHLHRQRAMPQKECIICKKETSNDCDVCSDCPRPQKCKSKAHEET